MFLLLVACKPKQYAISTIKATNIRISSADTTVIADSAIIRIVAPYKNSLDSQMYTVIGVSEVNLVKGRPNGNLNNFIADIIRNETTKLIGEDVDFAFTNVSGLRIPSIPKGNITKRQIFELLPFDNMIVAAKVKGETLKQILQKIADKGGEAISGLKMVISTDKKFISATYNSIEIDFKKDYIIATNDFLFNGGDNYTMLGKNVLKIYPTTIPIRDMVINHIEKLTATNMVIKPKADERIAVQ